MVWCLAKLYVNVPLDTCNRCPVGLLTARRAHHRHHTTTTTTCCESAFDPWHHLQCCSVTEKGCMMYRSLTCRLHPLLPTRHAAANLAAAQADSHPRNSAHPRVHSAQPQEEGALPYPSQSHAKASHGHSLAAAQLPLQQRSTTTSDIVRTQYVPLDDDSDSSDMEMEVHLMRKYGIKS